MLSKIIYNNVDVGINLFTATLIIKVISSYILATQANATIL